MQHSPVRTVAEGPAASIAPQVESELRAELVRLQRENRLLSIALAEMERVAERDMLTPLYNRRYFLSALHRRIAALETKDERSALIYIDVNGLKKLNDSYGHAAGDLALIEISQRLSATMRRGDVLARIGGDEFGLLIDQITLTEAKSWARRLQAAIEEKPVLYGEQSIALSAAFGVAMVERDTSAEEIIGRADAAMYRAKRAP